MDLKSLFNIFLLSLSLATVLITLVSFLLYKLKQLSVKGQIKDPIRMEGLFFVRYAPHFEKINKEAREKAERVETKKGFSIGLGTLFSIVVGVIATSLLAETYLVELQERRNKIAIVDNYRKLVDQGLLRRYDYSPNPSAQKLTAWNSIASDEITLRLKETLKSTKIFIASAQSANAENISVIRKWQTYLTNSHIPTEKGPLLNALKEKLVILPLPKTLTQVEKNVIESLLKNGAGIFLTGFLSSEDWMDKMLGIKFTTCPDEESFPTLFAVDKAPWWSLAPGTQVAWFPKNRTNCAFTSRKTDSVAAFESNYDGHVRYITSLQRPIVRAIFKNFASGRIGWLALDPGTQLRTNDHISDIPDQVIFSSLSWLGKNALAKIAAWPKGKHLAVSFGASLKKDNEFLSKHFRFFKKNKIPISLFVDTIEIDFLRDTIKEIPIENLDLAIDPKTVATTLSSTEYTVSRFDFEKIEKTRLDLEEQSARFVKGIHISRPNMSPSLMLSALMNRLTFAVLDEYQRGPEILSYEGRPFVWIPKYSPLNNELGINRLPASAFLSDENRKQVIAEDSNLHRLVTVYSEDLTRNSLDLLDSLLEELKSISWISYNFNSVHKWLLSQSQIGISLKCNTGSKRECFLNILNHSSSAVENVAIHLDIPQYKQISIYSENRKVSLSSDGLVHIPILEPGVELGITIVSSSGIEK